MRYHVSLGGVRYEHITTLKIFKNGQSEHEVYLESTTVETGHLGEGEGCARERRGVEGVVQGWGR